MVGPQAVDGGIATALLAVVDHIVVYERRIVQYLDGCSGPNHLVVNAPHKLAADEREHGA